MLASEKLVAAFNRQIGNEMGASLQYIVLATYFDSQTLPELAKFFYRQAEEEREHAMRFVKFVVDVGGRVDIPAIPSPRCDFKSAEDAAQLALDWEKQVTQQIYGLIDIAVEDRSHIARRFLDWFVDEQLEEMTTMASLLQVIQRAGKDRLIYVEDFLAREGTAPIDSQAGPGGGD
jgi:bacterioferritin B